MGLLARGGEYGKAYGSEEFASVGNSAQSLTVPVGPSGIDAIAALVSVTGTEPIKWRVDGVDPTAVIGHPLAVGGHAEIYRTDMHRFRVVSGNASTATKIFVTYFGE